MNALKVSGQSAKFLLTIIGYEDDNAEDVYDRNWLACVVNLDIASFGAEINASLTTRDLQRFYQSLQNAYTETNGVALLETDEGNFTLKIEFSKTGCVFISGSVQVVNQHKAHLSFAFESDQSHFQETLDDMLYLVQTFSIRE